MFYILIIVALYLAVMCGSFILIYLLVYKPSLGMSFKEAIVDFTNENPKINEHNFLSIVVYLWPLALAVIATYIALCVVTYPFRYTKWLVRNMCGADEQTPNFLLE